MEMYTGELFYEPKENIEHLAMIEKQCGPIPEHMARRTRSSSMRKIFLRNGETKVVDGYPMRIDWPRVQRKNSSHQSWQKMRTLDKLVQHQHNRYHKAFLDLLEMMMKIDPEDRPTARECLNHSFFQLSVPNND